MKHNIFKGSENEERNNKIWYLHLERGFTFRKLAKKFSISFQRIGQIMRDGEYRLLKAKVENNKPKK